MHRSDLPVQTVVDGWVMHRASPTITHAVHEGDASCITLPDFHCEPNDAPCITGARPARHGRDSRPSLSLLSPFTHP
jgi:hypothetical protein